MSSIPSNAPNLDDHLLEALKSTKDRISVLRLEQDIILFLEDTTRDVLEVPSLNSYQRRLAHKTGDYYQLTHVSDATRQVLLLHKHPWSKIPEVKLCDVVVNKTQASEKSRSMHNQPRQVQIMKRSVASPAPVEVKAAVSPAESASDVKEKEKIEKEERYKAARARIFQGVEESSRLDAREKVSKPSSRTNSRSNSRDARLKTHLNGDAADFSRRASETYLYEAGPVSDGDFIQKRHQQYFQTDASNAGSFQRPPIDGNKPFPGVWNPSSSAPLSAANLATLEAQTSQQPVLAPGTAHRGLNPASARTFSPATKQRSLAPPANASANLWGPPVLSGPHAQRSASAMGLNLSASPWTPKQHIDPEPHAQAASKTTTMDTMEDHEEDPANVLRGLALDDK